MAQRTSQAINSILPRSGTTRRFPIRKIRASNEEDKTRIVIDLYDFVYWWKPTQLQTDEGVLLNLKLKTDRSLKAMTRDIVIAIDDGHGGKYPGAVGPNNILEKDVTLLSIITSFSGTKIIE